MVRGSVGLLARARAPVFGGLVAVFLWFVGGHGMLFVVFLLPSAALPSSPGLFWAGWWSGYRGFTPLGHGCLVGLLGRSGIFCRVFGVLTSFF